MRSSAPREGIALNPDALPSVALPAEPGFLATRVPDGLPVRLREHLPAAEENARRNVERASAAARAVARESAGLLGTVHLAGTSRVSKVMMLRHVAGSWSSALAPFSACRGGCTHCCHIAVTILEIEAKLIAQKTGRRLQRPLRPRSLLDGRDDEAYGYEHPCVFLSGGECSIYEHRPLACRTLVNMDNTATLCELQPGLDVPVPYANSVGLQGRFAMATQSETFADIRDWFRP
jgi:uncharacterized protein